MGHVCFYKRFIKDLSKIARPMCSLLEKKMKFLFDDKFMQAFEALKKNLIEALTLTSPNLELPFEQMCDASDVAVGAALRKRKEKV